LPTHARLPHRDDKLLEVHVVEHVRARAIYLPPCQQGRGNVTVTSLVNVFLYGRRSRWTRHMPSS